MGKKTKKQKNPMKGANADNFIALKKRCRIVIQKRQGPPEFNEENIRLQRLFKIIRYDIKYMTSKFLSHY